MVLELEHLKIETRLINERFANAMGECENIGVLVYYESIKREPKIRGIKKCRCDERLKLKQRNLRVYHTLGWSWNWNT